MLRTLIITPYFKGYQFSYFWNYLINYKFIWVYSQKVVYLYIVIISYFKNFKFIEAYLSFSTHNGNV